MDKLARNEPVGRAPFGFRYENKRLVPDDEEQKIIEMARRLKAEGKCLREIVLDLHAGAEQATVWTCDFSYDYVRINAEYHT